jgi:hypothetical protein
VTFITGLITRVRRGHLYGFGLLLPEPDLM